MLPQPIHQTPEGEEDCADRHGFAKFALTAAISSAAAVIFTHNFLVTEKKIAHDIETDYGVGDDAFGRTMSHLLGPPLVDGNHIRILQNGAEVFPRMLEVIRQARRTITFENFVWIDGNIVRQFASAFAECARRGVKVHFLQDAMGSNCLDGDCIKEMREAGVEVEIFRRYNLTDFNHRTHRKILVADGKIGFVGGVGFSDLWDGHGDQPDHWRDTQYEVQGPVVAQLQQAFMDNWIQMRAEVLHGDDYFPELLPCGPTRAQIFKSSVSEGADNARLMFLLSMAAARETIRIVNPYFIPDYLVLRVLKAALARGVSVEIIGPSERIDQRVVRYVGRSRWGSLLRHGARFYEFQPALLHSKYFVVDQQWVSVGSCNLDDRSLCLNEEANLNVWDQDFARHHLQVFEMDKQKSREITYDEWKNRNWREKIIGHTAALLKSQL